MKKILILFIMLTLVVSMGILVSYAAMNRTQEIGVEEIKPIPEPIPCVPPNCIPGPMPYPDPIPLPCIPPHCPPSPWVPAVSNPNYEGRVAYGADGKLYGELRDVRTGEIVLRVLLPDGNNTHTFNVSPDGSTVFYDLGNTVYAQRIIGKQERISMPGRYTSISFEGRWAKLTGTVDGSPIGWIAWINLDTAEVRNTQPPQRDPNPLPPPVL